MLHFQLHMYFLQSFSGWCSYLNNLGARVVEELGAGGVSTIPLQINRKQHISTYLYMASFKGNNALLLACSLAPTITTLS